MIQLADNPIKQSEISKLCAWLQVAKVFSKANVTLEFENNFSQAINQSHSIFVNSGSSAIILALQTLRDTDRLKNEKIVIPALSWLTDISSVMNLGMTPILCDCNLSDLSVDFTHLEKIFQEQNPSCLILVTVLGLVPDMDRVVQLCRQYDVVLIEDNCESLGSRYKHTLLGNFGLMSVWSTYMGHIIVSVEGGFVTTNEKSIADTAVMLRAHGWDRDLGYEEKKKLRSEYNVSDFKALYTFYLPGFNFRNTDIHAFIGNEQLKSLNDVVVKRNTNYHIYNHYLKNQEWKPQSFIDSFVSNMAYPVISSKRDEIVPDLIDNGVETRPLIAGNLANQPFWKKAYPEKLNLPNAEYVDKFGFYVPNHPGLTHDQIKFICEIINKHTS